MVNPMTKSVTLELPERIEAELASAARDQNMTTSQIAAAALDDYLFVRKFRQARAQMQAQSAKLLTDEEVFEQVS